MIQYELQSKHHISITLNDIYISPKLVYSADEGFFLTPNISKQKVV